MQRTIIAHDVAAGMATVRFEHAGVTVEQTYNLWDVIPGTRYIFNAMGITELTSEMQLTALDSVTATVERGIDAGMIGNPPAMTGPQEPELPYGTP